MLEGLRERLGVVPVVDAKGRAVGEDVGEKVRLQERPLARAQRLAPRVARAADEDDLARVEGRRLPKHALESGPHRGSSVRGNRGGDAKQDLGKAGAHGAGLKERGGRADCNI